MLMGQSQRLPEEQAAVSRIATHIESGFAMPDVLLSEYLTDMTEHDLMARPIGTMNHWKWQLGHLVVSEHEHMSKLELGDMPPLPNHLREQFTPETSQIDDAAFFPLKEALEEEMSRQRAGTLALLEGLDDETLLKPSPERIRYFGPTVGAVFTGEAGHWMFHLGQLAIIRRHLGLPTL
jgi:hypothetical protein